MVLTLKLCPAGSELFFFLTLWCLIVVLPTNYSVRPAVPKFSAPTTAALPQDHGLLALQGTEVDRLLAKNTVSADSPFVYWVPPPTTAAPGSTEATSSPVKVCLPVVELSTPWTAARSAQPARFLHPNTFRTDLVCLP